MWHFCTKRLPGCCLLSLNCIHPSMQKKTIVVQLINTIAYKSSLISVGVIYRDRAEESKLRLPQ